MSQSQIQALEQSIKDSRKTIELDESLARLMTNRDFKKVIQDNYLEREAVRLVHALSDPAMDTPAKQAAIIRDMNAIASFKTYLVQITQKAGTARRSLAADEETREELLSEDLSNG